MIVKPKTKGFICTTAHPTGCFQNVKNQIEYVKSKPAIKAIAPRVLVIGASTGYGLSARIALAFSCNADTIGVSFERCAVPPKRTASAGFYNNAAFEKIAEEQGLYAKDINGDAYSNEVKQEVISLILQHMKQVDLVIYSLASPRRKLTDGTLISSTLKTVGESYTQKTVDLDRKKVHAVTIEPAVEQEVADTIKVMGGEDWCDWIKALSDADVLASNATTVAFSYIGPELTHPIYKDGSIGRAKKDLFDCSVKLSEQYGEIGLKAYISVNKALVTQSSAAIPIVPLYISILYKVMKNMGLHEGCIEQMDRLFREKLLIDKPIVDENGMLRLDDLELSDDVQEMVSSIWKKISDNNFEELADLDGYRQDFLNMFGFNIKNVDYDEDVEI